MHYFQAVSKNNYDHISDTELLERFYQDNQTQWLGLVLQRYTLLLLGVCMKYLKNEEAAKDAVQQIFLKAITELSKHKVTYFKSWLYMVARNHCLMQLRDKNRLVSVDDSVQIAAPDPVQPQLAEKEITLTLLETSLEELNPEQKTCVTLFYLKKKSYQAITEETGFSLLQVKSYIQNGKRNLKLLLEKKMNRPE
jgi:RNA polymerase sigma factor (sigma-70 family)